MAVSDQELEELRRQALDYHRQARGKIEVVSKVPLHDKKDLSLAYTPGVAEPCKAISADPDLAYEYTAKSNLVAVVTDGTAVLGLGDIGPEAAMPVMEGKAVLFKSFAGVDAFPVCLGTKEVGRIVEIVKMLEPTFGGVNLEDISAPRCFEIEARLKAETNIPVFHDDQHGTAIVTAAAVINALKLTGRRAQDLKVIVNGAGAAGIAVTKLLLDLGVENVILCDRTGAIYKGRPKGMNPYKDEIAGITNPNREEGDLAEVMKGADLFVGLSAAGAVTKEMVRSMAPDPMIMAMANPVPEIYPEEAREAGARIVATGRSDYPNQINNVLAFPGVFRGALDVRARGIDDAMKMAAARAIAELIGDDELREDYIIPSPWDGRVAPAVAAAVAAQAIESGLARVKVAPEQVAEHTRLLVERAAKLWQDGDVSK